MYTIDQVSMMTGLTTRTLRNYIKADILHGNKAEGVWQFSEEQVQEFIMHPSVVPSIQTKHNAIVYDFLAESSKPKNEACVLLDLKLGEQKAHEVSQFFCDAVNRGQELRFSFSYREKTAHIILRGAEAEVQKIMQAYYCRER